MPDVAEEARVSARTVKHIDPDNPPKVEYCVPTWVRDLNIKKACALPIPRLQPTAKELVHEPMACVGFGASLHDTLDELKTFSNVMTCSGAHKFVVERGIIPKFHIEVDPREHKVGLIGPPQKGCTYLISSACHPKVFKHLMDAGCDVVLWHIFDGSEEGQRVLPAGEWAITGGCSVGVRMLTLSRFMGYTDLHIFGMDGCESEKYGKHADKHPMQPLGHSLVTVHGREFKTTSSMFTVAQGIWHELNMLPDVTAKFYGDGMIQHMAKFYERKPFNNVDIGVVKAELISSEYRALNKQLHDENFAYGCGGERYKDIVLKLIEGLKNDVPYPSVLDYGCGKGRLQASLPFAIFQYDPAMPPYDVAPAPADIVICTDVLEHIEPDNLMHVLMDLRRVVKRVGYFVIHTGAARKTLPDGRNTHLIQKHKQWWHNRLKAFFTVGTIIEKGKELHCIVGPVTGKAEKSVAS